MVTRCVAGIPPDHKYKASKGSAAKHYTTPHHTTHSISIVMLSDHNVFALLIPPSRLSWPPHRTSSPIKCVPVTSICPSNQAELATPTPGSSSSSGSAVLKGKVGAEQPKVRLTTGSLKDLKHDVNVIKQVRRWALLSCALLVLCSTWIVLCCIVQYHVIFLCIVFAYFFVLYCVCLLQQATTYISAAHHDITQHPNITAPHSSIP